MRVQSSGGCVDKIYKCLVIKAYQHILLATRRAVAWPTFFFESGAKACASFCVSALIAI